jgi:hypothetical protein
VVVAGGNVDPEGVAFNTQTQKNQPSENTKSPALLQGFRSPSRALAKDYLSGY